MLSMIYLITNAVVIGLIGSLYLLDPNILLAQYGLEAGGIGMDNMLRASYGGIFLAAAIVLIVGILSKERRRDVIAFTALFMFGAAIGRVASIAAMGVPNASIQSLLYYEIAAAVIGFILILKLGKARD